jgi:hypothetical protein
LFWNAGVVTVALGRTWSLAWLCVADTVTPDRTWSLAFAVSEVSCALTPVVTTVLLLPPGRPWEIAESDATQPSAPRNIESVWHEDCSDCAPLEVPEGVSVGKLRAFTAIFGLFREARCYQGGPVRGTATAVYSQSSSWLWRRITTHNGLGSLVVLGGPRRALFAGRPRSTRLFKDRSDQARATIA